MPAVVGIDLSSFAVDLVRLDENTDAATWTRADLTGKTAFDRLRSLRDAMPTGSWWDDVYLVGIERVFGPGGGTQAALQRVYGAVVALIPARVMVWEIHSTEWRKALGLPGNASKEECAEAVLYGLLQTDNRWSWPQDALDAYAIAYCARESNAHAISEQLQGAA